MTTSFFFSPRNNSGFTWGVGPVFDTPSSYQPTIGSGHYSIGPTGVALQQTGKWTIGALVNQVWSVAGDRRREEVNQIFLQPFLAYQATRTVTLTVNSETTGNWEAHGGDRWSVPLLVKSRNWTSSARFPPAINWVCRGSRRTRILDPHGTSERQWSFCCRRRSNKVGGGC
jgi:hypothetical protein